MVETQHLSTEEVACCADAINEGKYASLDSSIRNHLAQCDECASEVLMVTDIAFDFSANQLQKKTIRFKPWQFLTVASAAAIVFFVIIRNFDSPNDDNIDLQAHTQIDTLQLFNESVTPIPLQKNEKEQLAIVEVENDSFSKNNQPHESTKQVIERAKKEQLIAYTPDETLEKLFNNYTQAYRGNDIKIVSTGITYIPESDSIRWINYKKISLLFELFNNHGEKISAQTTKTNGIYLKDLPNGVYYWKLINDDFDLLHVGKIVVKNY